MGFSTVRISDSTIAVSARAGIPEDIRKADPGTRFVARVLEKFSNTRALIDIKGNRLQAEFLRGIPDGKTIVLVMDKKTADSLFFRIESRGGSGAYNPLLEYTVYPSAETEAFASVRGQSDGLRGIKSIFELNLFLLGLLGFEREKKPLSVSLLLNRLQSLGVKFHELANFSYLFCTIKGINLDYLFAVMNTLGQKGRNNRQYKWKERQTPDPVALKGEWIGIVERALADDREGAKELIMDIINALQGKNVRFHRGYFYGSVPVADEESFREMEFVAGESSLVVSVSYSVLGSITVLARDHPRLLRMDIFGENENTVKALGEGKDELSGTLRNAVKKDVEINLHIEGFIVEKILELNSDSYVYGGVDQWA